MDDANKGWTHTLRWTDWTRFLRRRPLAWQPLDSDSGWRCQATDALEVLVTRDPEVGWRVELRDAVAGQPLGRPTFSRQLQDAARIGRYLTARYAGRAPA
jgi:hypothetical protein